MNEAEIKEIVDNLMELSKSEYEECKAHIYSALRTTGAKEFYNKIFSIVDAARLDLEGVLV